MAGLPKYIEAAQTSKYNNLAQKLCQDRTYQLTASFQMPRINIFKHLSTENT